MPMGGRLHVYLERIGRYHDRCFDAVLSRPAA